MKTWNQLIADAQEVEGIAVVSLLKPYFCPATGGKFKRGHRFNVSPYGKLWLKDSTSIKWQYEPAIEVDADAVIPTAYFLVEESS